jgi:hypothetical protein
MSRARFSSSSVQGRRGTFTPFCNATNGPARFVENTGPAYASDQPACGRLFLTNQGTGRWRQREQLCLFLVDELKQSLTFCLVRLFGQFLAKKFDIEARDHRRQRRHI